jgi:putative transposase
MKTSYKIRLLPSKEQESLFYQHIGCCRYVWNWALDKQMKYYESSKKRYSPVDLGKMLTQLKSDGHHDWLYQISNASLKESIRDLNKAFDKFYDMQKQSPGFSASTIKKSQLNNKSLDVIDLKGHPKFKSKKKEEPRFYTRYDRMKFNKGVVQLEKIGQVKYRTNYDIPQCKYLNPRVNFDGKYWYLSFSVEKEDATSSALTNLSMGIDVGVKDLAICSDGSVFKNINKSNAVRKLKKKLVRLQRQVSRKYELNKKEDKFVKTSNIIKLEKQIKLLHRRITNIRNNHIHQATCSIVKTKPYRVVMEDLNISGMMKNRHLSKAIQEQGLFEFARQIKYKCQRKGIDFVAVDRFYPSSKTCSCCGFIKKELKLKDRVFDCLNCFSTLDRDWNASINLAKYGLA